MMLMTNRRLKLSKASVSASTSPATPAAIE
jgi:hypothetical protein